MGKGDRKTAKGKRSISSYGNVRSSVTKVAGTPVAPVVKKTADQDRGQGPGEEGRGKEGCGLSNKRRSPALRKSPADAGLFCFPAPRVAPSGACSPPRLHRPPHPQQVGAQDLADVGVAVAAPLQAGDQVRVVGHRAQALGQLAADAVEVRADADMVDAHHLHRMVDLVEHRIQLGRYRRMRVIPGLVELLCAARGFAGSNRGGIVAMEVSLGAEIRLQCRPPPGIDERAAEHDLHHATLGGDRPSPARR